MLVAIKPHFENMFIVFLDCVIAYNAKLFEMGLFHERKHDRTERNPDILLFTVCLFCFKKSAALNPVILQITES